MFSVILFNDSWVPSIQGLDFASQLGNLTTKFDHLVFISRFGAAQNILKMPLCHRCYLGIKSQEVSSFIYAFMYLWLLTFNSKNPWLDYRTKLKQDPIFLWSIFIRYVQVFLYSNLQFTNITKITFDIVGAGWTRLCICFLMRYRLPNKYPIDYE